MDLIKIVFHDERVHHPVSWNAPDARAVAQALRTRAFDVYVVTTQELEEKIE